MRAIATFTDLGALTVLPWNNPGCVGRFAADLMEVVESSGTEDLFGPLAEGLTVLVVTPSDTLADVAELLRTPPEWAQELGPTAEKAVFMTDNDSFTVVYAERGQIRDFDRCVAAHAQHEG